MLSVACHLKFAHAGQLGDVLAGDVVLGGAVEPGPQQLHLGLQLGQPEVQVLHITVQSPHNLELYF